MHCVLSCSRAFGLPVDSVTDWVYWSVSPGHRLCFRRMDDGMYEVIVLVSPPFILNILLCENDSHASRTSVHAGVLAPLPKHHG